MSKFVEYDPTRGMEIHEDVYEGRQQVHYRQDVEPLLEYTKLLRNEGATDIGIKNDMWHYAQIPQVVIYEMLWKHGVDIFNKDHQPKMFKLLNQEYAYLKTTNKNHMVKN